MATINKVCASLKKRRRDRTASAVAFVRWIASRFFAFFFLFALLYFSGLNATSFVDAEDGSAVDSKDSIENFSENYPSFRYWKIPAESLERCPWGTEKYYPLRRDLFKEWLDLAAVAKRLTSDDAFSSPRSNLISLQLDARLNDDSLEGTGTCVMDVVSDVNEPFYLVRPLSFALSIAKDDDVSISPGFYPDGRFYIPDSMDTKRFFYWSQRGKREPSGTIVFDLSLPPFPCSVISVRTSGDVVLTSTRGVVKLVEDLPTRQDEESTSSNIALESSRLWRVYLGGSSQTSLTMTRQFSSTAAESQLKSVYRQDVFYRVSLQGIDASSVLEFTRGERRDETLAVDFDEGLTPLSIQWNGEKVARFETQKRDDEGTTVLIPLPNANSKGARDELKIDAFCPLELDVYKKLPSIRLNSEKYSWKETLYHLTTLKPLVAATLNLDNAIQARDALRARQDSLETTTYKLFEPNGSLSLKLRRLESEPAFDSITDCLIVAQNDVTAKTTLLFNLRNYEGRNVAIPLAPGWKVSSASSPDGSVLWNDPVEEEGTDDGSTKENGARFLRASFERQSGDRENNRIYRINFTARYSETFDDQIEVDRLSPLDLSASLTGARAIVLRAESPNQIKLTSRSGRPYVAPKTVPNFAVGEAQLRDAQPAIASLPRLYFGEQTIDAAASLENQRANYSLETSCLCDLRDLEVSEVWKLRCEPRVGARVDRIVFFVTPRSSNTVASSGTWRWTTSTEPDKRNVASRLSEEETELLKAPEDSVAYEIRLSTSRSVPFELNLYYELPTTSKVQIPLLFFPEATRSSIEVIVESSIGLPFWIHSLDVEPSTLPLESFNSCKPLSKAFRYDSNSVNSPELTASFSPFDDREDTSIGTLPSSAWCWFENIDSFYEMNGMVRNRASFFIENREQTTFSINFPTDPTLRVRAVWIDDKRVSWLTNELEDGTTNVVAPLPTDRRFICIGIEYASFVGRVCNARRLQAPAPSCDIPVFSGSLNVWTPPQYLIHRASTNAFSQGWGNVRRFVTDLFASSDSRIRDLEKRSLNFAKRFGSDEALRKGVLQVRALEEHSKVERVASDAALTLGDVLGSNALTSQLFAISHEGNEEKTRLMEVAKRLRDVEKKTLESSRGDDLKKDDAQTIAETSADAPKESAKTETSGFYVDSPFGTLVKPSLSFNSYVDRFAFIRLGLLPSTPLPKVAASDPIERARLLMDSIGLVVIVLDENTVLFTAKDLVSRDYNARFVPFVGGTVLVAKTSADARVVRSAILGTGERRFVRSNLWKRGEGGVSPWGARAYGESSSGWTRASYQLERVKKDGVYIVNRYFVLALELFSFLLFLSIVWKRDFARPRFFMGFLGVCAALICVCSYEMDAIIRGLLFGDLCAFGFYFFKFFAPDASSETEQTEEQSPNPNDANEIKSAIEEDVDNESTEGFVDFDKLSPEERRFIQGDARDNNDNAMGLERRNGEDMNDGRLERRGAATMKTIEATVLTILCFFVALGLYNPATRGDDPNSVEPKETVVEATDSDKEKDDEWKEPSRVFDPVDSEMRDFGDYYWVDSELYDSIKKTLARRPAARNWRVVDALYEGEVNYNSLTETTSLFNLNATYKLYLESTSATISFPALQLASDVAVKFDKQTVVPTYGDDEKELSFDVEDVTPGLHVLELLLAPPQFSDSNSQISLPILRSPSARLELTAPIDAPLLEAPNALGATMRGAGRLTAELGAVDTLILKKMDANDRSDKMTVDVEQFFLMRPRPMQTNVRAAFNFQVVGGKLQTLEIECDPLYSFSGFCQSPAVEIDSIDPPTVQNNAMRVTFKNPVSGAFVLNVDFVARDFAGAGRLSFPRIAVKRARVVKNWLALSPVASVVCADMPESTISASAFESARPDFEEPLLAVYDLTTLPRDAFISARQTSQEPSVSETTTYIFHPSETEIRLQSAIDASTETFRLSFETPQPFVVDSISLLDEKGVEQESPDYFLTKDGLVLNFINPIKGKRSLTIVGRAKTIVDEPRLFPVFCSKDVLFTEHSARVFCSSSVYLDWTPPNNWTPLDRSPYSNAEKELPADIYRVDEYSLENGYATSSSSMDSSEGEISDDKNAEQVMTVRVNSPKIVGRERIIVYSKLGVQWKASVEFRLTVQGGRLDRFYVLRDEACVLEPLEQDSIFTASETTTPSGEQAILFEPKTPIRGAVELKFTVAYKNGLESVRLPRFKLLESSLREDASGVNIYAYLPKRCDATALHWSVQNMRLVSRESPAAREMLRAATRTMSRSTAALALNGAASDTIASEELPTSVTSEVGMSGDEFSVYELEENASAALTSDDESLQIARARSAFYIRNRNLFFGSSSFDIRPSSRTECTVIVPKGRRLLEAVVNGSRRMIEQIDETHWRIDLDSTPYSKRLELSFLGDPGIDSDIMEKFRTNSETTLALETVRIQNAHYDRESWICAFNGAEFSETRWQVYQRAADELDRTPSKEERAKSVREPLPLAEADELLFRSNAERAVSLLEAFETDAAMLTGTRSNDIDRFRARWNATWRQCENELASLSSPERSQADLTPRQRNAFIASFGGVLLDVDDETVLPSSRATFARYREAMEQKKKLEAAYFAETKPDENYEPEAMTPQEIWLLDAGADSRLLFGATDRDLARIVLAPIPARFDFWASSYSTAAFILVLTAIFLQGFKKRDKPRGLYVLFFGTLVVVWTLVFFVIGWKSFGLIGAILLSVGPPTFFSVRERFLKRKNLRMEKKSDKTTALSTTQAMNWVNGNEKEVLGK